MGVVIVDRGLTGDLGGCERWVSAAHEQALVVADERNSFGSERRPEILITASD
jgi:hypothetical protein